MTQISPWRGDPIMRRAQEVAAEELRGAYTEDLEVRRLTPRRDALNSKIKANVEARDAHLGMISETLRFHYTEAASCLRAMDPDFVEMVEDLDDFVEMSKRRDIRTCGDCRSLTAERKKTEPDALGFVACDKHRYASSHSGRPIYQMILVESEWERLKEIVASVGDPWDETTEMLRVKLGVSDPPDEWIASVEIAGEPHVRTTMDDVT